MTKRNSTRRINGDTYVISKQSIKNIPQIKKITAKEFHKLSGELLKEGDTVNYLADALENPKIVAGLSEESIARISEVHQQKLNYLNKKLFELQQLAATNNLPIDEILKQLKKRKIGRKLVRNKNQSKSLLNK